VHFKAPVQQVAAGSIHNEHHYHHTEPPGPDESCDQVRDCPQCKRRTWALSQHCHHCKLDLWQYERRSKWGSRRMKVVALVAMVYAIVHLDHAFWSYF
jgi:hypothetical protein